MTRRHQSKPEGGWGERLRLPLAFLLVNVVFLSPTWILQGSIGPPWVSLEAVAVVGVFALLPVVRWSRWTARVAGGVVVILGLLLVGDTAARMSFNRPLNLYLDFHLVDALGRLLTGTLGLVPAVLTGVAAVLFAALLAWAGGLALAAARTPGLGSRTRWAAAGGFALLVAGVAWWAGRPATGGGASPGAFIGRPAADLVTSQARQLTALYRESREFSADLARSPSTYADLPGLLERLDGSTVILAFVESYGISALEDPRYADVILPRLEALDHQTSAAGLTLATGALVAPTQGGLSWLSHGSLLSGLWVDNQLKYDLLLASRRETLIDDFKRAGYETVALMPAITLAWPEGRRLGYDSIYARDDIDYAGPPLNWVTMPDQFTWSFLEGTIRPRHGSDGPLFAEVGLISSHAPWTPILTVLDDWDAIGDGTVFSRWRNAGERPEDLWRDQERVRDHYARSVGYAIDAVTSYARRYADEKTLLIVLGDHQPAPLITGDGASWAVPVHVISRDPELVAPFLDWGFVEGALPVSTREPLGMDYFRDWFVRAYSGAHPAPAPRPPAGEGASSE